MTKNDVSPKGMHTLKLGKEKGAARPGAQADVQATHGYWQKALFCKLMEIEEEKDRLSNDLDADSPPNHYLGP